MTNPLGMASGTVLKPIDGPRIIFVECVDGWVYRFLVEGTDEEYFFEKDGQRVRATARSILEDFAAGTLKEFSASEATLSEWQGRYLGIDRAQCFRDEPRSVMKYDLALAALRAGLPRSATPLEDFAKEFLPEGTDPPCGRSIIRWMNVLTDFDERIGAMRNRSGRRKGQSQLPRMADLLVKQGMALYWSHEPFKKMHADALVVKAWQQLKDAGVEDLGDNPPSKTTIVNRINANENKDTTASKHGKHVADKHFNASGETTPVTRPFDLVMFDGVEFEALIHYSSEKEFAPSKMKAVQGIDVASLFAFPTRPFAGPFRSEMGNMAILNVLTPPSLNEETLEANPMLIMAHGRIGRLRADNEKANIPPYAVTNLTRVVRRFELAARFSHDEKAQIENYFGWLKAQFDGEPGIVLSPRSRRRSIRRDAMAEASMTRESFAWKLEQRRLAWNSTAKTALGNRTPNDVMLEHVMTANVRVMNPSDVRRSLARTVKGVLTTDGVTVENNRYRWNRTGITKLLSENLAQQAFAKRLEGTARCEVVVRVFDWCLDFIEVFDETNNDFVTLWSIDPDYTTFLTKHEHDFHVSSQNAGLFGGQTRTGKALAVAESLRREWENLDNAPYGIVKRAIGVIEAAETRLNGGLIRSDPDTSDFSAFGIPTAVGGMELAAAPRGPSQSRKGSAAEEENGEAADAATEEPTDRSSLEFWLGLDPPPRSSEEVIRRAEEDDPDEGIDWGDKDA